MATTSTRSQVEPGAGLARNCYRTYGSDPTAAPGARSERNYCDGATGEAARTGDTRAYASKQDCIADIRRSNESLAKAALEYCEQRFGHQ